MEESVNPTLDIGPVSFDLTPTCHVSCNCFDGFAFVYWASRKMTPSSQRANKMLLR